MGRVGLCPKPPKAELSEWLDYIQRVHFRSIDMTLDRVSRVLQRLGLGQPAVPVITVSGTNGKGSTVAMLESIYGAAGYSPGAFTSPHLCAFNERIRVGGECVQDSEICDALGRVEGARAEIPLTYFEFCTLAALLIFADRQATPLLLEVGLGGRLDAVNAMAADVAIVTSVGLDHQAWLGENRELIGREKAGIFRPGKPAICADPEPPATITETATRLGARLLLLGRDFGMQKKDPKGWHWHAGSQQASLGVDILAPPIAGERQWQNTAAVLMALTELQASLPVEPSAIHDGLAKVSLDGRLQTLSEAPRLLVDVAHNPQAAEVLAAYLRSHPVAGRTYAIYGALADKAVAAVCQPLSDCIDQWLLVSLTGQRGSSAAEIAEKMPDTVDPARLQQFADVDSALARARALANIDDCIVAFGSFLVAGVIISRFKANRK